MKKLIFLFALLGGLTLTSCNSDADLPPLERYEKAHARGVASSTKTNDFFLGLELGIAKREYYARCTVLNKNQQITMAGGGNAVDHQLPDELDRPAVMTFAPDFGDSYTVEAMDLLFTYVDWSPWNKNAHSDKLLKDVAVWMDEQYGGDWIVVPHEVLGSIVTQVNNNRAIAIWMKDSQIVQARFTDLSVLPEEKLGQKIR